MDHLNYSMAKGGFHNSCKLLAQDEPAKDEPAKEDATESDKTE